MAKYLVTGGCGFIGSHLTESLLNDGHEVIILDNLSTGKIENHFTPAELIVGDIQGGEVVKNCMKDVDGCFHLAAIASVQKSNEDWAGTHGSNLTGCINVFNAAKERRTPVVYASSAAVYGNNIDVPLTEESTTKPITAYGADKLGCELHARVASIVHQVPTTGLRFFNVYGPRQDPSSPYSGVISIFHERIKNNKDITIFGDGEQTRDFVYVGDIVRFLRSSMENSSDSANVYNACTGKRTTINQLAKIIMRLTDRQSTIYYQPARSGDIFTSIGDPRKAAKTLGVSTENSVYEGLDYLLNYEEKEGKEEGSYSKTLLAH